MEESYVKTTKQAAQAMQEKGYRIFASCRIVSVATAKIDLEKLLVKAFVRPSMEGKPAIPLWMSFLHNNAEHILKLFVDVQLHIRMVLSCFCYSICP